LKTIYPNKGRITFKAIVLVILSVYLVYLIKQLAGSTTTAGILMSGFLCLVFLLLVIVLAISFLGIYKVEAIDLPKQIIFYRIFSKQVLPASAITGYYVNLNITKNGTYYGRILTTLDDKIYVLDPANLKDINKIDEYLKGSNVKYLGEKELKYPFIHSIKSTL
jgi:hypothetical protein